MPAAASAASGANSDAGVTTRDVRFFSEGVQCYGKLFLPSGFSSSGNIAAIVVAPGWNETAASVERQAAQFAGRGLAALAIDYRGWGKSGAFIYLADQTRWDDRLRFSQHTSKVRLRRKRLIPDAQVIDIRNAITYLQGEPGIDANRIGAYGAGVAGTHVVALAANDARVRVAVSHNAAPLGKGAEALSFAPTAAQQAVMVKLARTGQAPATVAAAVAMNEEEARLAMAEYRPFAWADQIPKTAQILYADGSDLAAAADWFTKHLAAAPTTQ